MSSSLQSTSDAIRQELEEATYEFKVQYNDRPLSAESYLAESLDAFKHSFKQFAEEFGRPQMHELLKHELDQKLPDTGTSPSMTFHPSIPTLTASLISPRLLLTLFTGTDSWMLPHPRLQSLVLDVWPQQRLPLPFRLTSTLLSATLASLATPSPDRPSWRLPLLF
ncbi:hypothetical protein LB505_004034 [Fusarium chuoi]|nr:hypothetical protein LB505_004034 [Fusarium chuoi]